MISSHSVGRKSSRGLWEAALVFESAFSLIIERYLIRVCCLSLASLGELQCGRLLQLGAETPGSCWRSVGGLE